MKIEVIGQDGPPMVMVRQMCDEVYGEFAKILYQGLLMRYIKRDYGKHTGETQWARYDGTLDLKVVGILPNIEFVGWYIDKGDGEGLVHRTDAERWSIVQNANFKTGIAQDDLGVIIRGVSAVACFKSVIPTPPPKEPGYYSL